jgi:hypothetical protein
MIKSIWNLVFGGRTVNQEPEAFTPEPKVKVEEAEEEMDVPHEGLHLFDLNEMLLEKIMSYLSIPDLVRFSMTSRTSKKVKPFETAMKSAGHTQSVHDNRV